MFRFAFILLVSLFFAQAAVAQADVTAPRVTKQSLTPAQATLLDETSEVEAFARKLELLKIAFAEKDPSRIVAYEAYVLSAMRQETDQLSARVVMDAAQTERRKTAAGGQITPPAKIEEAPARDPFAEASTPTEARLEKMQMILASFERHAFDPAQPEAAARDFAKLDEFLQMMREDLARLQPDKK
jgi:hypothetical protein